MSADRAGAVREQDGPRSDVPPFLSDGTPRRRLKEGIRPVPDEPTTNSLRR